MILLKILLIFILIWNFEANFAQKIQNSIKNYLQEENEEFNKFIEDESSETFNIRNDTEINGEYFKLSITCHYDFKTDDNIQFLIYFLNFSLFFFIFKELILCFLQ